MSVTDKSKSMLPQLEAFDNAGADIANGHISGEYEEYLRLKDVFVGTKLQKLVRKVDLHVLPQLVLIYLLSYIDRSNVGNAKLFSALTDLKMSGQDWNTALAVFFITYAAGGVPSNIALKRWGPKFWLPILLTAVGIVLVCSGLQSNMGGWTAFRVILGAVEAGVFPGCSFILTAWYDPKELHSRMSLFYSGASLAGAFSGLLAYGIGQLDGTWGYHGWRFIYVIEGLLTVIVGLLAFVFVYPSPEHVKSWLSEEERQYLVLRHKFAAGGETSIAEKESFNWKYARQAFMSIHIYAIALMEFTLCVVVYGASFILPTVIKNLGYSAVKAQAMTVPPYVFACLVTIASGFLADRYQKRMLSVVLPNLLAAVGFIIILASVHHKHIPGVTLFGVFLVVGGLYPISPAVTAWVALNTAGSTKRAVAIGSMISFSQLGGIMGSNIYISTESPYYPVGFGLSLAMLLAFGVVWPPIYMLILKRINARRATMSAEEIRTKYTDEDLADMGDESPLFRYAY
ncbi:hypothetical protein PV11_07485 [Exophiala sideris]|uniref:Major facilitator superfamily (MFS) profile domain-containing protein n=1 Tax=Exophiala sideris TaxID=1016849 RepID=A0A0D1WXR1_9EURO|nr:hypothetical protein PV11_07485 [Exophiala sideris]